MVGLALGQHLPGDLGVPVGTLELVGDLAVPIEAEPAEAVEDRRNGGLGGAGAIGVLDAQLVPAAVVPGEQPVEQRGAGATDMEVAGRRRGESGDDGHVLPQLGLKSAP
jgi:hypothetical protein